MLWNLKSKLTEKTKKDRLRELVNLLLKNRHLSQDEFADFVNPPYPDLSLTTSKLTDLDSTQLTKAISLIKQAIDSKKPILIYGDYDCDGVCATTTLYEALVSLGASVTPFIPHRLHHGYGLSEAGLTDALSGFKAKALIITVDNGITANETVDSLRSQGHQIIITDHHQIGSKLPAADAIVHTTLLSGTGVAWLLSSHLTKKEQPLDLVALATVCDLLPLTGVNRLLVKHGIEQMRHPKREGLKALYHVSGIVSPAEISAYHLGFILGPRINAVGRLGHAHEAFRLLISTDYRQSLSLAHSLTVTNQDRQDLTTDYSDYAIEHFSKLNPLPNVLFLADERFHEGIVGLIAAKLVERFHRPALVASLTPTLGKGSARSIPGFDITDFLKKSQSLLLSVGGHHQAAGFSFDPLKTEELTKALTLHSQDFPVDLLTKSLDVEVELSAEDLSFELLDLLDQFAPFGIANPEPVFSATIPLKNIKTLGKTNNHLKVFPAYPFQYLDIIGFNLASFAPKLADKPSIQAAFYLKKNTYMGNTRLQLLLKDIQADV